MLQAIGQMLSDIATLLACADITGMCINVTALTTAIDDMLGGFAALIGQIMSS